MIIERIFAKSSKTYVVGTQNRLGEAILGEAILMSTHNIGFYEEMCKIIP